jgi:hypothetical protein
LLDRSPKSNIISINRHKIGYGQEKGGLVIDIYNSHPTGTDFPKYSRLDTIRVVYFDSIHWILKLYLSTLEIKQDGKSVRDTCIIHYFNNKRWLKMFTLRLH